MLDQALLDWLAVEFMDSGWSVKHMLHLMLTSETYRRSCAPNETAAQIDPLNKLSGNTTRAGSLRKKSETAS